MIVFGRSSSHVAVLDEHYTCMHQRWTTKGHVRRPQRVVQVISLCSAVTLAPRPISVIKPSRDGIQSRRGSVAEPRQVSLPQSSRPAAEEYPTYKSPFRLRVGGSCETPDTDVTCRILEVHDKAPVLLSKGASCRLHVYDTPGWTWRMMNHMWHA